MLERWWSTGRRLRWGLLRGSVGGGSRRRSAPGSTSLRAQTVLVAAMAAAVLSLAASCQTASRAPRPRLEPVPVAPQLETWLKPPLIRVGILPATPRVSVSAESGVWVWGGPEPGAWKWRSRLPQVTALPLAPAAGPRFRVQVASLMARPSADEMAQRVEAAIGSAPDVRWNEPTRTYRLRVGDFETREGALSLAARLGTEGFGGCLVVEEAPRSGVGRLRVLETGEQLGALLVLPESSTEDVLVDGRAYAGLIEIRLNDAGSLTVVNIVGLEEYLRGVVPNELSPAQFPEIEALKAQAVAARTYALRNLGGFESRGYDICATAACQVYRGRASEDSRSDEAVAATEGVVALYRGRPINAYYTSTCGGHTEDGANIFETEAAPYLQGVACVPERNRWAAIRTRAKVRDLEGLRGSTGREIDLLIALGVIQAGVATMETLAQPATEPELRKWTSSLISALHRQGCKPAAASPLSRRAGFFEFLVDRLCWSERAQRLLAPGDSEYLLPVADRDRLTGPSEQSAAALLIAEGVLFVSPIGQLRPSAAITRSEALGLLARAGLRAGLPGLLKARLRGVPEAELAVLRDGEDESYPVHPSVRLYRSMDGRTSAVSELTLVAGEEVWFVLSEGDVVFLEARQSRLGVAADHASRYYRWDVSRTPEQLARSLARYGSVGKVREVRPLRLGSSGRVVEASVLGDEGEVLLKGLEVREGPRATREPVRHGSRARPGVGGHRALQLQRQGLGPRGRALPGRGLRHGQSRRDLRRDPAPLLHWCNGRPQRRALT